MALNVASDGNTIAGNNFSLDPTGATATPNAVAILVTGNSNTIGGGAADDGNVIRGFGNSSGQGIWIKGIAAASPNANVIQGNRVGAGVNGTASLGAS